MLRDVHIILDTTKRSDYLFSFNLDLLTLAHENFYFNTLDLEKVQGKSLGCIKSPPRILYTHVTGSHRRGMKEPHAAREPRVADPCLKGTVHSKIRNG